MARCVAEGLAGVESLSGIPGSIGATPIQNVGAYGQEVARDDRRGARARPRDRRDRELAPEDCGFAYRSSAFKRHPGRWVVLAVTFALERRELSGPLALRGARAHARRPARRGRAARRGARGRARRCAAARAWCSTPATPTRCRAGSFFTNPILDEDAFAALEERAPERAAALPGGRRPGEDVGRVADRARRLPPRLRQPGRGSRSPPSTRSRSPTAAAAPPPSCSRSPARSPAACSERFGVTLEPEPTLVGVDWP